MHMKKDSNTFEELLAMVSLLLPRMTRSVEALLFIFFNSSGPISVSDILKKLVSRRVVIDKVTVYRKLEQLLALGVIQEVLLSGEKRYYELTGKHHHHLVCLACERVTDWMPDESLLRKEERRLGKAGFRVRYHSLELFGVCKQCA